MRVIVSQAENNWRYWLKMEGQSIFSSKTREDEPIDLRNIDWVPSSIKKIQKLNNNLYEKLVKARSGLRQSTIHYDDDKDFPLILAWDKLN